jgi:hypothetical protein
MKTADMQKRVAEAGQTMRREEYAGTGRAGQLVSRHRWTVHTLAGSLVVRGTTPAQCFKRWRERQQ